MQRIRLVLGGIPGLRIFRNNAGMAELADGTMRRYGLCPGSSDLIGWKSVLVTPEMVGRPVALFVAIEVKSPRGRRSEDQRAFVNAVKMAGGIAGFAESDYEAVEIASVR